MAKDVKSELQQTNPWWFQPDLIKKDDKIVEFESQTFKYLPDFYNTYPLNREAIFIIRGPRQVGKTTLIKLLLRKLLLEEKMAQESVCYYSLDRIADYDELFALVKSYLDFARPRTKNHLHIFLDEVTFVSGWVRAIKDLADRGLLRDATLTLTGSNILELTAKGERLPGRRGAVFPSDINLYPLNFADFLKVTEPDLLNQSPQALFHLKLAELEKRFQDYLLTGGFMFAINRYFQNNFLPPFVYEMFANWVTGDMLKLNRSENFTLRLLEQVPKHLTSRVSFARLAREAGMASGATANEYIELLEQMFVLLQVPYLSLDQKRANIKKNKKLYFQDPFIMASLIAKAQGALDEAFSRAQYYIKTLFLPKMAEMLTAALLQRCFPQQLYYGMSKNQEIDFAGRKSGNWHYFEVKYQSDLKPSQIKSPQVLKNRPLTVITENTFEKAKNLSLVPLSIFLAFPEKFIP